MWLRSKTDQEAEGAVVYITPRAMQDLDAIRPPDVDDGAPVFGLSPSQIARRIGAAARAAGLGDGFGGHRGRVGMASWRRRVRQTARFSGKGGGRTGAWWLPTRGESRRAARRAISTG